MVPLSDVKISVISPNEFTISYVNKLPNTHFFRLQTNELCQSWINSLGLAIQQDINYPFIGINTRSNSFSNSFAMIRGTASKLSLKSSKSHSLGPLHKPDIQDEQFEGYYKPIRLDIDELRRESGGCLSNLLQLQEVYYSSEALEFDRSSPVKQGWRPLGGTFTDLLYWCLLTSDRSDKSWFSFPSLLSSPSLSLFIIPSLCLLLHWHLRTSLPPLFLFFLFLLLGGSVRFVPLACRAFFSY